MNICKRRRGSVFSKPRDAVGYTMTSEKQSIMDPKLARGHSGIYGWIRLGDLPIWWKSLLLQANRAQALDFFLHLQEGCSLRFDADSETLESRQFPPTPKASSRIEAEHRQRGLSFKADWCQNNDLRYEQTTTQSFMKLTEHQYFPKVLKTKSKARHDSFPQLPQALEWSAFKTRKQSNRCPGRCWQSLFF